MLLDNLTDEQFLLAYDGAFESDVEVLERYGEQVGAVDLAKSIEGGSGGARVTYAVEVAGDAYGHVYIVAETRGDEEDPGYTVILSKAKDPYITEDVAMVKMVGLRSS
jgi:hypothetical protein